MAKPPIIGASGSYNNPRGNPRHGRTASGQSYQNVNASISNAYLLENIAPGAEGLVRFVDRATSEIDFVMTPITAKNISQVTFDKSSIVTYFRLPGITTPLLLVGDANNPETGPFPITGFNSPNDFVNLGNLSGPTALDLTFGLGFHLQFADPDPGGDGSGDYTVTVYNTYSGASIATTITPGDSGVVDTTVLLPPAVYKMAGTLTELNNLFADLTTGTVVTTITPDVIHTITIGIASPDGRSSSTTIHVYSSPTPATPYKAPSITVFFAGGTWTKPSGAVNVTRHLIAPGGGGGGGRRGAAAAIRGGGGGGGGGGYSTDTNVASKFSATETVAIGAVGTAGAAASGTSTDGGAGTAGGNVTMTATGTGGATLTAGGGGAGQGGTITTGGAGGAGGTSTGGEAGGAGGRGGGAANGATGGATTGKMAGGGGGGGWGLTAGAALDQGGFGGTSGGIGGAWGLFIDVGAGDGNAGFSGPAFMGAEFPYAFGGGGGGGATATTATAGTIAKNGGPGNVYGGGGGGGGGCTNGVTTFNGGGVGGSGLAIIVTTF